MRKAHISRTCELVVYDLVSIVFRECTYLVMPPPSSMLEMKMDSIQPVELFEPCEEERPVCIYVLSDPPVLNKVQARGNRGPG